ncbi:zebrafish testis-expressed 38 [Diretmus argenteus]
MSACISKTKEDTAKWTSLFLDDLKTEQASLVFVKRMVALAVSSITYMRGIFPEDAYRSRYLEDLCIKILREDCSASGARKIVTWMMGCFHALERQYLQVVFIGVHTNPDEPNCIIESYQFKFRYTEKGPQMDILRNKHVAMQVTMEDTKKASMLLIRKLFLLMQNLDVLPNNVYLSMKLFYYDAITPADYQPPGFEEGECDKVLFEGTAMNFRVGEVETAFHTLKVCVAAEQGRMEKLQTGKHLKASGEAQRIQDPHEEINDKENVPSEDETKENQKPCEEKKNVAKTSH